MAPLYAAGVSQHHLQLSSQQSRKAETGLLSRLFGSLRGGSARRSSAASGPGGHSVTASASVPCAPVWHQEACAKGNATGSTTAVGKTWCSSAPFLNYQTGITEVYSFDRELGKGGNGVVRVLINRETGEEFASKSIKKVLTDASEKKKQGHLDSIRREVQVLTKLRGSLNVVKLEGVYEDEEYVHIVMEMCKGGELWHRIGDRHYSERTVASFMRAVLRTLAQCHAQNIMHRDIKPGNFMLLSGDDRAPVKAIDFGLAAPFDPEKLPRTDLGLEGTPWYMAPETLRGDWYPASDVWAAGVMAFQLLCGRFPFDDKANPFAPAITAIWRSVLNDPLDFSKPWWAGVSEEAKDFCRLLLNRDVAARPSAQEALKHPWLRGDSSERSIGKRLNQSVVARIQRFAAGSLLQRTVLQSIAAELLSHPHLLQAGRAACTATASGRPIVAAPDAACLRPLLEQLRLEGGAGGAGGAVDEKQLGETLARMGFRLTPCEVSRLMEQVDVAGAGAIDHAAFAASQMDWRHLQKNHTELWLDLAAKAFRSLDADGSGVLEADELVAALRSRLPPDELQTALEAALQEAAKGGRLGAAGGAGLGGMGAIAAGETVAGGPTGIDFEGFMNLLRIGSLDSLDLYDDRISVRSGGNGSVDRYNTLLAASLRTTDWSRHSPGSLSRHNGGGLLSADASVHSQTSDRSDVAAWQDNGPSLHGSLRGSAGTAGGSLAAAIAAGGSSGHPTPWQRPAGAAAGGTPFRFDHSGHGSAGGSGRQVAGGDQSDRGGHKGRAGGSVATAAATSVTGVSGAAGGGMVWRFDVIGRAKPPPPPPEAPVWRFDVAGSGSGVAAAAAGKGSSGASVACGDMNAPVGAGVGGGSGGACSPAGKSALAAALGRQGGYCDRRMHGSDLYRNVALKALQAAGQRNCLDPVAE